MIVLNQFTQHFIASFIIYFELVYFFMQTYNIKLIELKLLELTSYKVRKILCKFISAIGTNKDTFWNFRKNSAAKTKQITNLVKTNDQRFKVLTEKHMFYE